MLTAFRLRRTLNDFVDCLILSSAINRGDALVTEDEDIHALAEKEEFRELLRAMNPGFKIQRIAEAL